MRTLEDVVRLGTALNLLLGAFPQRAAGYQIVRQIEVVGRRRRRRQKSLANPGDRVWRRVGNSTFLGALSCFRLTFRPRCVSVPIFKWRQKIKY